MNPERRSFLSRLGVAGIGYHLTHGISNARSSGGFTLGSDGGEHLIHFRDHGDVFIKAGSGTGADNVALGTQQVKLGTGIPIHRHPQTEEAFYVLGGSGIVTLDDTPHPVEEGGTIFIPKNTWHGFSNPDHELLLLWIVSPPGLDAFFRETCSLPGSVAKKVYSRAGSPNRPKIRHRVQVEPVPLST
jgi:quercetin dioxygenase-like cupin family protein